MIEMNIEKRIPPLMHFIWAGGRSIMNAAGMEIISEWIKYNKDIEDLKVYIWVDKETGNKNLVTEYKKMFAKFNVTVFDGEEDVNLKNVQTGGYVILKDIRDKEIDLKNEYVKYEIEKLRPNYGASSDLLRYEILYEYGGFYCDCTDVESGKNKLKSIFSEKYTKDILYVEHCTQRPKVTDFNFTSLEFVGNDIFICNPKNKLVGQILEQTKKNYSFEEKNLKNKHIFEAHSGKNIKNITIWRTGPGTVQNILFALKDCSETPYLIEAEKTQKDKQTINLETYNPNNIFDNFFDEFDEEGTIKGTCIENSEIQIQIRSVRGDGYSFSKPSERNTTLWLKIPITECDYNQAIKYAIQEIEFEAKHFHILRLDDHILDIQKSIENNEDPVKASKILEDLHICIQNVQKNVLYTQITGKFQESITYAQNNKLGFSSNLNLEMCKIMIDSQASVSCCDYIIYETKSRYTEYGNVDFNEQVKYECSTLKKTSGHEYLCSRIEESLDFFENFLVKIDQLIEKENIKEVSEHCLKVLERFKNYAEVLNEVQYNIKFEINAFEELIEKFKEKCNMQKGDDKQMQFNMIN